MMDIRLWHTKKTIVELHFKVSEQFFPYREFLIFQLFRATRLSLRHVRHLAKDLPVKLLWLWKLLWAWGCAWGWGAVWGAGDVKSVCVVELKAGFGPGEPWGDAAACAAAGGLTLGWGCSTRGCLRLWACWLDDGCCCLCAELGTWARGDCWKVAGWKALSGAEELRLIGGPNRASKWGLLLKMEEVVVDEGVGVVAGGEAEVMVWDKAFISWVEGLPEKGVGSKSPPNSMSWLLMSWSMSVEVQKNQKKIGMLPINQK